MKLQGLAFHVLAGLPLSRERYVSPYWTGVAHLGLGNLDAGLSDLERARESRFDWLLFMRVDPLFDYLRAEPRFENLVRRVETEYTGRAIS